MTWIRLDKYREQFDPPPSRAAVLSWVRAGTLEKHQPAGPGGTIYVRPIAAANEPESEEDQIRRALNGSA